MKASSLFRLGTLIGSLACAAGVSAAPVSTAFTYQGQLKDGGAPANGDYDLRFSLYDGVSGGNLVAGPEGVDE